MPRNDIGQSTSARKEHRINGSPRMLLSEFILLTLCITAKESSLTTFSSRVAIESEASHILHVALNALKQHKYPLIAITSTDLFHLPSWGSSTSLMLIMLGGLNQPNRHFRLPWDFLLVLAAARMSITH